jgi:hypothetical protein
LLYGIVADAPESRGLENSIINLADSLSSQPDSTAPAPVEVPGDRSDATLWVIMIVMIILLLS